MPIVPSVDRRVAPDTLPGVRVSTNAPAAAYGGNVAQAMEGAGNEFYKQAIMQKQKDDTAAVINASNAMSMDMLSFFNGENGIFSQKGENARGSLVKSQDWFNKTLDTYTRGLSNKSQALAFQQHMKPNAYNFLRNAGLHEQEQLAYARKQDYKNGTSINNQLIASNYANTDVIRQSMARNNQLVSIQALDEGWTPETISAQKTAVNTDGIKNAFTVAMDNKDFASAGTILTTFGKEIDPTIAGDMQKKLDKENFRIEKLTFVDELWNTHGMDLRSGLAAIKEKYGNDANKIEAVRTEYQSRVNDEIRIERQTTQAAKTALREKVASSVNLSDAVDAIQNDPYLSDDQKRKEIQKVTAKHNTLSSGKATPEQKYWANYELKYLSKDLVLMEEYRNVTSDSEVELKPTQQTKYNKAASNLNNYYQFMGRDGYQRFDGQHDNHSNGNPFGENDLNAYYGDDEENSPEMTDEEKQQAGAQWYNNAYLEIKAAYPDSTDEEIKQFMTKIITQNGG